MAGPQLVVMEPLHMECSQVGLRRREIHIQELRPKTVHATGSGDSGDEFPSSQERPWDPHKEKIWPFGSVCSQSVAGSVQGNLEIFWEQS